MESDEVSYGDSEDDAFFAQMETATSTECSTNKTAEVSKETDARIMGRTPRFPAGQSTLAFMLKKPAAEACEKDTAEVSAGTIRLPGLRSTEMIDAVFNKAAADPSPLERKRKQPTSKAEDPAALREAKKVLPRHSTDPKSASAIKIVEENPNQGLVAGIHNKLICLVCFFRPLTVYF